LLVDLLLSALKGSEEESLNSFGSFEVLKSGSVRLPFSVAKFFISQGKQFLRCNDEASLMQCITLFLTSLTLIPSLWCN
ncbi:hypothetical protein T4B_8812, partial [Trichinella pseudospiralis]